MLLNNLNYFVKLYIAMTKSKFSASSFIVPSFFVILLVGSAQFLNDTCVAGATAVVTSPLLKYKHRCNHKDYILKLLYL